MESVKVGVGAVIINDGKALLCKRKNAHGENEYGSVGGHLEFGESLEDCIKREALEELGIEIGNLRFICVSNIRKYENKHYLDVEFLADIESGTPCIMETNKASSVGWFPVNDLPEPLFEPLKLALESVKTGKVYHE